MKKMEKKKSKINLSEDAKPLKWLSKEISKTATNKNKKRQKDFFYLYILYVLIVFLSTN